MKKATSFIGEHTIELTIVPKLKEILKLKYEFVIPIFPWMTREGGNISKYLHQNETFYIFGLYPRRPKIKISDKENIYLKINEQIIIGAQSGLAAGIPIIAGLPLVKNFWELDNNPQCLWINLDFEEEENLEFKIKPDEALNLDTELSKKIFQKENTILNYIEDHAKSFEINEAMNAFRKIKMDSMNMGGHSSFAFMGGYKPIYFLLK